MFGVSRSGLRHYNSDTMTQSRIRKTKLIAEVKEINNDNKLRVYGSPRITTMLQARGYSCSENTVAKLMSELGIEERRAKPFKPKTTKADHTAKYSPNALDY